jgi:AraC-like DNA-binding protein
METRAVEAHRESAAEDTTTETPSVESTAWLKAHGHTRRIPDRSSRPRFASPDEAKRSDATRPAWRGTLTLGSWWLLYEGAVGTTARHRHHAVQIIAAQEPVVVKGKCGEHRGCALVVPPDVDHAIVRGGKQVTLLYVDAESPAGRHIAGGPSRIQPWNLGVAPTLSPHAATFGAAAARAEALIDAVLGEEALGTPRVRSETVAAVVSRLGDVEGQTPRLRQLADGLGLSPSRLSYRFKTEVGITIRGYRRWARLSAAIAELAAGSTLTEAAHNAGFADLAHLSRTFRSHLGLAPTEVLAKSRWLAPQ